MERGSWHPAPPRGANGSPGLLGGEEVTAFSDIALLSYLCSSGECNIHAHVKNPG